jgi:hypothetical protein
MLFSHACFWSVFVLFGAFVFAFERAKERNSYRIDGSLGKFHGGVGHEAKAPGANRIISAKNNCQNSESHSTASQGAERKEGRGREGTGF